MRDLFYATPARLKFLKSPRTEQMHAVETPAAAGDGASPTVGFSLSDGNRTVLEPAGRAGRPAGCSRLAARLGAVLGREFSDDALPIDAERQGYRLTGYAGLPTLNRGTARAQYLFVNGRPVRDKLLYGAVRGAYQDFLASNRHPLVALFLELPPARST